ncbi:MAG: phosphoglucosamine mutase, partial [Proteobacteria bacterium]|nr:phosphoglucosamine mutase [Pseudomonadota bacterium]
AILARSGKKASEILSSFTPVPQKLVNLRDMDKAVLSHPDIKAEMQAVTDELGDEGRTLLRPSGTEPLIRVMVEALDEARLDAAMQRLVTALKAAAE